MKERLASCGSPEQLSVDPADHADRDLLKRIAARDRGALREFFLRYEIQVRTLLRRMCIPRESVEENVINTFTEVWRDAHLFRAESRVLIWLFGIAYRLSLIGGQNELVHSGMTMEADFIDVSADMDSRPEWLSQVLIQLPFTQRAVVELAYGLRLSSDEIAYVMQCPTNTVKIRLFLARQRMDLARATARPK